MPPREPPTCAAVSAKACLQVTLLLVLVLPMFYIYVLTANYEPYHRGFFCSDDNLKHPYKEQTVPIVVCLIIWALLSILFIVLVETLRTIAERGR